MIQPKKPKPKICACPCGEKFIPYNIGQKWVNQKHYQRWLLETEKGQAHIRKQQAKATKIVKSEQAKKDLEAKIKYKPENYQAALQIEINKLSKMIDASFNYHDCICCNNILNASINAAHFHSVGSNATVRYNLHNVHSARTHCNNYSAEHKSGYILGLEARYGKEYLEKVQSLVIQYSHIGLKSNEIYEKLGLVRKIIRNFSTYKFESSVQAREMLNKIIGIYV